MGDEKEDGTVVVPMRTTANVKHHARVRVTDAIAHDDVSRVGIGIVFFLSGLSVGIGIQSHINQWLVLGLSWAGVIGGMALVLISRYMKKKRQRQGMQTQIIHLQQLARERVQRATGHDPERAAEVTRRLTRVVTPEAEAAMRMPTKPLRPVTGLGRGYITGHDESPIIKRDKEVPLTVHLSSLHTYPSAGKTWYVINHGMGLLEDEVKVTVTDVYTGGQVQCRVRWISVNVVHICPGMQDFTNDVWHVPSAEMMVAELVAIPRIKPERK